MKKRFRFFEYTKGCIMYEWKKIFPMTSLGNGKLLFEKKKVDLKKEAEEMFSARVHDRQIYHVKVMIKTESNSYKVKCDCPMATGGQYCRHMAATLYAMEYLETHPETEQVGQTEVENLPVSESVERKPENVDTMQEEVHPAEDEYITMNGESTDIEAPVVDWDSVELDNYEYFIGPQIFTSMNFPQKIQREAKKLMKDGNVELGKLNAGYYERGNEVLGECFGIGYEGSKEFPIHVIFNRTDVLRTDCQCKKCGNHYYYYHFNYGKRNDCPYTAALLMLMEGHLKDKNIADATDKVGMHFLHAFQQKHAAEVTKGLSSSSTKMSIRPKLVEKEEQLSVSFRIEAKKSFVIKDLEEFYYNVQDSADAVYGSSTTLNHDVNNFTEKAQKWISYIGKIVSEERAFENAVEQQGGYVGRYNDKISSIALFGSRLDELYDLIETDHIEYEKRDAYDKGKRTLTCKEGNPKIRMSIRKNDLSTRWEFHGIAVSYDMPKLYEGLKTGYYIEEKYFLRLSEDFYRKVEILERFTTDQGASFQIGRNYLTEFYHTVLPQLEEIADITEEDYEEIASYLPPKVKFIFYLDAEKGDMSCKVMAKYGDREYNASEAVSEHGCEKFRDIGREADVFMKAARYFPYPDEAGMELTCGGDEQCMYEVLHSGIEMLLALGEVRCTRRFSNLKLNRKFRLNVGVSLSSGLLDLTVSAEDIAQDEIADILKSYRAKKKYHKLKNGDFLNLEDESIAALGEMAEILRWSPKELLKGKIHVPTYRALYLDKLLEKNEEIYNTRDSHFRALVKNFKTVSDANYDEPDSLKQIMREYQRTGYRWLRTLEQAGFGGILADDMGLGKTLQVIAVLLAIKEAGKIETSLVVSPASLVYNWSEEIKRFAPALSVGIIAGTQEERRQKLNNYQYFDVLITSYDLLKRDIAYYEDKQFLYQIIDEAQYIKNHTTAAAKAVKVVKSKVRYALTGTPIENRLSELWSIFDYLMPGYLYGYETFRSDFETPIVKYAEQEPLERLKKLTSPFILRRLKEQVLKDLPDKLEENYYVKLEGEQQKIYDAQVLHMKKQVAMQDAEEFKQNKLQILAELMKIRQICCDPSLCFENYKGESAKLETCLELVKSAIEGGHRILLFSQFTSMLEILEKQLKESGIEYFLITGSVSKEKRLQLVQDFNQGNVPVFLISLKAGGVGLNLTGADVVIHYDPWWNLAVQNQATDRAHRIGQTKKVVVYKLLVKDSIEEKIHKLQEEKRNLSEQVIQGEANMLSSMSREDFLSLLEG